jgi:pyruvate phosphate dikinase-like enzyme
MGLARFAPLVLAVLAPTVVGCRRPGERAPAPDAAASAPAVPSAEPAAVASAAASAGAEGPVDARPVWVARLDTEEAFRRYSKEVGGERFTKFVIDLKTSAVYYVDAEVYPMHKDFIFAELLKAPKTKEAVAAFDQNYGPNKPQFVMCYLVHHLGPDLWTFAFWDGDRATAEHVRLAYGRMKDTFYLGERVKFRPNSNHQEGVAAGLEGLPIVTNDQIYKASGYQPFHKGKAVGPLRVVPAGADFASLTFSPDEIVVLPEPLADITPVAGIVLHGSSTPLSHVNLRAGAWGIPNVAARSLPRGLAALAGKIVAFEAGDTSFSLREATAAEREAAAAKRAERVEVKVPKANLAAEALVTLDGLRASDASAYGSKTANLGEIVAGKLAGVAVPPGFGVPVAHYARHLRAAGVDAQIEAMLVEPTFRADANARKAALAAVRQKIVDAPLDPAFVDALGRALEALTRPGEGGAPVGVFVRSSTNAEDLPGFSGAGLYDTVPNAKGLEAVAAAVKKVWASVWNYPAYEERELYRIDHRKVYGAALVQVGVDATAAGVLVTAHPTDPAAKTTYTINAKNGLGMRVVEGKKVPEIILYNVANRGLRVVSRSDEETMLVFDPQGGVREAPTPKGQPVLTNERVAKLGEAARKIRGLFSQARPLDIEWVLRGEELFIVQARPYVEKAAPREAP